MKIREQAPPDAVQVPGWPAYKATKDGRVFGHKGELKQRLNQRGYPSVTLQDNGRMWYAKVSRVVALTYLGQPEGRCVRHLNDNPLDSRLENLAYGTIADNAEDARRNGKLNEGEKHGNSIYTAVQVRKIRELRNEGVSPADIARRTGVHYQTVHKVLNGSHWRSVA